MTLRLLAILGAVWVLATVLYLLRGRRLREKYAALWLFLSLVLLVLALAPELARWVAQAIGVALPSNLMFVTAVAVLFVISVQISVELGHLEEQSRTLAEEVAMLRLRVEELEGGRVTGGADQPGGSGRPDESAG